MQEVNKRYQPNEILILADGARAEIPGFVAIQKKYADKGFTVIGVSLDKQGPSVVKPFMRELGMNYPVVM